MKTCINCSRSLKKQIYNVVIRSKSSDEIFCQFHICGKCIKSFTGNKDVSKFGLYLETVLKNAVKKPRRKNGSVEE